MWSSEFQQRIKMDNIYEIAIIGGGPAGYTAAIRAAQKGAKVVLFEKDRIGGTCLNRGCIPTKTYLKTTEYVEHIKRAFERGILCSSVTGIDMAQAVAHKNDVVKGLTDGIKGLLRSYGINVCYGTASLINEHEIICDGEIYKAENIILCGGSKVDYIDIEGIDHRCVLSSDEFLDLKQVPDKICVIGGGVVGCELASVFAAFGSKVYVVEAQDRILSMFDDDVSTEISKTLDKKGVKILTGRKITKINDVKGRPAVITNKEIIECDKVLLSVGRSANLECLGKLMNRITVERGKVVADSFMRTNITNIYACGDINGKSMLAHSAYKMAEVAVNNCFGANEELDLSLVPSCLYSLPEAAAVGMTERDAKDKYGQRIRIGRFNFSANGRSLAAGERVGFVKVVADTKYGEILGVHIVGSMASEMISEATALMTAEMTVDEIAARIIHPHPSCSEAFGEACADVLGLSVHLPKKKND